MNPSATYTFTSCPSQCSSVDSQSYINYSGYGMLHLNGMGIDGIPAAKVSSTIHINPKICSPGKSIHINKALIGNQSLIPAVSSLSQSKTERVHYNPKFFKSSSALTNTIPTLNHPLKLEGKIHINPNFIRKDVVSMPTNQTATSTPYQNNKLLDSVAVSSGIHVNPAFLQNFNKESSQLPNRSCESPKGSPKQNYVSKYKISRNVTNESLIKKDKFKHVSPKKCKFKLVKDRTFFPSCIGQKVLYKSKYSLARISQKSKASTVNNISKRFSLNNSFQNVAIKMKHLQAQKMSPLMSYRKSVLRRKIEARRQVKSSLTPFISRYNSYISKYKYVRSPQKQLRSVYKNHRSKNICLRTFNTNLVPAKNYTKITSEFKSIGRTKLVRKSVLQKQIESRMKARKSDLSISPRGMFKKSGENVSKYRLIRTNSAVTLKKSQGINKLLNKKSPKKKRGSLRFSSDKYKLEKRKKVAQLTKKLRKNNQPCPFYHRYGRCKAKDRGTCTKLHDPKYIAICKRFLKGDCKDEKCSLSHDVRPEKMPTCHHYLAGLCKRTDCPYLHIKVNQKAPICKAFLQGFCADVFNCIKRHEYICPIFAEKGSCLRGKSCSYPHKTTTIESKLLEKDEFPLLRRKRKPRQRKVSITNENVFVNRSELATDTKPPDEEVNKSKEFTRYFLAVPRDDSSEESDNPTNEEAS